MHEFYLKKKSRNYMDQSDFKILAIKSEELPIRPRLGDTITLGSINAMLANGHRVVIEPFKRFDVSGSPAHPKTLHVAPGARVVTDSVSKSTPIPADEPVKEMGPVEKILREAKNRINTPEKWTKGMYYNEGGAFCAIGAIQYPERKMKVSPQSKFVALAADYLVQALPLYVEEPSISGVFDYNDSPKRTHADIMALYDIAIAKAAADGV
jgi:hypothetical protein